ncbi:MAG TPA: hypothetical protein VG496_10540 [Myxococcales bacterium]|nr:hypothetical protein [Myxococcales bacterium]
MRRTRFPWLALALLAACTKTTESTSRARPDLGELLPRIHSAALVSIEVTEYEVAVGGVPQLKEDWSAGARQAIADALATELRSRQIELRVVDRDPAMQEEINDLRALSEAINASLAFPSGSFDYSLGPVRGLVDRYRVDALVFVWGRARLPTGGQRLLAALHGKGGEDVGQLAMTIVDSSGDVVWFNHRALVGSNADLRQPDNAAELVHAIVSDLPAAHP